MTFTGRRVLLVVALAVGHVLLTTWAMISALGAVMAGFDDGRRVKLPSERFYSTLSDVLLFPLLKPGVGITAPGLWGYLIFLANGLLWAVVLVAIWSGVRTLYRSRAAAPAVRGT
jgi:hypothetical protein